MKLEPEKSASNRYVKFKAEGDMVRGIYVRLDQEKSPWGIRPKLILKREDGHEIEVNLTENLAATLRKHEALLKKGPVVTIKLVELVPSSKGNPFKRFEVEVDGVPEASSASAEDADTSEAIPF